MESTYDVSESNLKIAKSTGEESSTPHLLTLCKLFSAPMLCELIGFYEIILNIMEKFSDFEKKLKVYWLCEARDQDAANDLRKSLSHDKSGMSLDEFKQILDNVILTKKFSVERYEALTGLDCDSVDGVVDDLKILRGELFGGDPD